mgnify:CR=1 FL=1
MTKKEALPTETLRVGDEVKVYVVKVEETGKGPKVFVSRTNVGIVKRLFENEVPEIKQGIVEIKAVSREAGQRSKIAIYSSDPQIDAVGACVGNKGARVNAIVAELGGEKIDIIPSSISINSLTLEVISIISKFLLVLILIE